MSKEIVIVGGVAAGMSAASKLRREDKDVNITVYEKGNIVSYGACGLPYFISDKIKESKSLIVKNPKDFEKNNITVKTEHEVKNLDADNKNLLIEDLKSNNTFEKEYDQLVITTGASPVLPNIKGKELDGIYTLRDVNDGEKIKKEALDDNIKNVAIIGAGYIGLELCESFIEQGKNVKLINRSDKIMKTYDDELRELLLEELENKGVKMHLSDEIKAFNGNKKVQSIKTDKDTYEADLVIVSIGVKPNSEFIKNTDIKTLKNGAIIVDKKMKTNIDDVYAAGDVATVYHKVLKENRHIPLATYANKQGKLLGEILAGKDTYFEGGIGTSIVKVMDITLAQTGINENDAKSYGIDYKTTFIKTGNHAGYYPGNTPVYIKYIYDKNSKILLGAQLAGKSGVANRINVLSLAIDKKMTTEEIAYSDFSYAPPFSGVWDALQVAASASK